MASKTKIQRQQEERIKQAIVSGHRRGVCDKNGNSTVNSEGAIIPVYEKRRATSIYKDGKWIKVI